VPTGDAVALMREKGLGEWFGAVVFLVFAAAVVPGHRPGTTLPPGKRGWVGIGAGMRGRFGEIGSALLLLTFRSPFHPLLSNMYSTKTGLFVRIGAWTGPGGG